MYTTNEYNNVALGGEVHIGGERFVTMGKQKTWSSGMHDRLEIWQDVHQGFFSGSPNPDPDCTIILILTRSPNTWPFVFGPQTLKTILIQIQGSTIDSFSGIL